MSVSWSDCHADSTRSCTAAIPAVSGAQGDDTIQLRTLETPITESLKPVTGGNLRKTSRGSLRMQSQKLPRLELSNYGTPDIVPFVPAGVRETLGTSELFVATTTIVPVLLVAAQVVVKCPKSVARGQDP
jgi:hypothetical protein